jgi:hypothetical protein
VAVPRVAFADRAPGPEPLRPAAEAPPTATGIVLADGALRPGRPGARPAAPDDAALAARFADPSRSSEERLGALDELLRRCGARGDAGPFAPLCATLAAGTADGLLPAALQRTRSSSDFTAALRAALLRPTAAAAVLDNLAVIVVATRLGGNECDAAVRRVARRRPGLLPAIAAATRQPGRAGSALLLLDLWTDQAVRRQVDDEALARMLFAGQPAAVFVDLLAELDSACAVPRRAQCLLALGNGGDRAVVAPLLLHATSGCRAETYAAAWALAQLPHDWLGVAARTATADRDAFVLRAALARARLPAATAWTVPLGLTAHHLALLAAAPFADFPACAEWFRDGPRLSAGAAVAAQD